MIGRVYGWTGIKAASVLAGLIAALLLAGPARAQELLQNRSFELPVTPANGNNFYVTIPDWTIFSATSNLQPSNIVRPWSGYAGNPTVTPTDGGVQYFDVNSSAGTARQTVTVTSAGLIDFGAWFSVRDSRQALSGLTVNIRNSSNTIIASASTSFTANDPIGLWKQANVTNVPVTPGTYIFEIVLPDPANADLASMVLKPPLAVSKTISAHSDPVNGTASPKLIPGALAEYAITVSNPASYTVSADTIGITDATPADSELSVVDFAAAGSGPADFVQGSPSSGLTYGFAGLASAGDDIEFSNDGGLGWTYAPVANASGVDPAVTHVRLNPKGGMAAGSSFTFRLRYRVR